VLRLASHLAAFLIAAAAAYAGLADARPLPVTADPPSTSVDRPAAARKPGPAGTDWPGRIEARMAALEGDAVGRSADPAPTRADLVDRLSGLARRGEAAGLAVGVHVRDLRTGATVFDRSGDQPLNPASNHKLLTSVAAVELLGSDYQFETRLARSGDALYLVGGGDPTLQLPDLYGLAQAAVAAGLDGVDRIVVDDSAFSEERFGPGYGAGGPGLAYLAPSGALSLAFNTVVVTVHPTEPGEPVRVEVSPEGSHVRIESSARTGSPRALEVQTRAEGDRTVVAVTGGLAAARRPVVVRRRIHDPGHFTAAAFARILAELDGAPERPVARGRAPAGASAIAVHRSLPLPRALEAALKYSNNFCTEQVLRTLAWRATGRPGSWADGTAIVERFWARVGGDGALAFVNGSGLSRAGRATPRALVDLVARTQADGTPAAMLAPTLAGAGGEGTLRTRLGRAGGRVRAKTGTLRGVSALSGVVAGGDGRAALAFSILVNGNRASLGRTLQDGMVLAMLDELDREHALPAE
jgi:D-alanyl-D-alanine carboxypeptidase/D-alanyl-D-alanine-endopeptidase (penicillin-binding protein 4)